MTMMKMIEIVKLVFKRNNNVSFFFCLNFLSLSFFLNFIFQALSRKLAQRRPKQELIDRGILPRNFYNFKKFFNKKIFEKN